MAYREWVWHIGCRYVLGVVQVETGLFAFKNWGSEVGNKIEPILVGMCVYM